MARTNGSAHHNPTWPETTTLDEVMLYATRAVSDALILFVAAERAHDTEQMTIHCKSLRNIATRVDQFRRMRVRQWQAQPVSYPTNCLHPVRSVK
jgi:hypothetical protein